MATNIGGGRKGAIRNRTQVLNSNGYWTKVDTRTGRYIDQKADTKPFKSVRRKP